MKIAEFKVSNIDFLRRQILELNSQLPAGVGRNAGELSTHSAQLRNDVDRKIGSPCPTMQAFTCNAHDNVQHGMCLTGRTAHANTASAPVATARSGLLALQQYRHLLWGAPLVPCRRVAPEDEARVRSARPIGGHSNSTDEMVGPESEFGRADGFKSSSKYAYGYSKETSF